MNTAATALVACTYQKVVDSTMILTVPGKRLFSVNVSSISMGSS